jgi:hypothetical protein
MDDRVLIVGIAASLDFSNFELPGVRNEGDDWGAFRFLAGWLLRSGSLPLAVITGMLGVGLLGATASSFVRQQGTLSCLETCDEYYLSCPRGEIIEH